MSIELSEQQRRTVAAAVTIVALCVIVTAVAALLWLLAAFVQTFSNVFLPLAVAGIAALVLNPWFEWLRRRMPTPIAVALVFLSVLVPLVAFVWFFGHLVVDQLADLVRRLPVLWRRLVGFVQERWPEVQDFMTSHPVGQRLRAALEGRATPSSRACSSSARRRSRSARPWRAASARRSPGPCCRSTWSSSCSPTAAASRSRGTCRS